jgi:GNAT superfamily N-acetyltransferase
VLIRAFKESDRKAVGALDTSFETRSIFDVVTSARGIALTEKPLAVPRTKRYANADIVAQWSKWDTAFVAEVDRAVVGFAGVEYEAWHERLVLWHLYVAPSQRRKGVARALLERCEAHGRDVGAARVWLETSSVNVPGVLAYERLGYALCGADVTLYEGLPYTDEAALYLTKKL